jgi:hypothetical protein
MFARVLGWIMGGGLSGIAEQLQIAHRNRLQAQTDEQKLAADITIKQLEARQNALIHGKGAWLSKAVQATWALPFIIFNFKVIVWDKVLKLGVTDPLGQFEQNIGMIIVGFYFLTTGAVFAINQVKK